MKRLLVLFLMLAPIPALAQTAVSGVYKSSPPTLTDGVQQQLRLDSTGALITAAATTSSGTGASADQVQGNAASGATDAGNPVKVGGKYVAAGVTLTDGQRGDLQLTSGGSVRMSIVEGGGSLVSGLADNADGVAAISFAGRLSQVSRNTLFNGTTWDRQRGDANGAVVQPALSSTFWKYAAAASGIVNTTTAVTAKAAAGASVRNYVMSMQCSHDTLGAVTEFAIRDGAAGTIMYRGKLNTTATDMTGNTINFEPPLQGTANTLVEIVTLTAVTGGVYCNLQGYTGS